MGRCASQGHLQQVGTGASIAEHALLLVPPLLWLRGGEVGGGREQRPVRLVLLQRSKGAVRGLLSGRSGVQAAGRGNGYATAGCIHGA
jgi:hypothetical protein